MGDEEKKQPVAKLILQTRNIDWLLARAQAELRKIPTRRWAPFPELPRFSVDLDGPSHIALLKFWAESLDR